MVAVRHFARSVEAVDRVALGVAAVQPLPLPALSALDTRVLRTDVEHAGHHQVRGSGVWSPTMTWLARDGRTISIVDGAAPRASLIT